MKKITMIGAGPVGSMMSLFLARKGYDVEIFERRADMRKQKISAGKSINLAVSVRGIHAMKELGISDEILKMAVPMRGRMMHSMYGELTYQSYGTQDWHYINSIPRGELNKKLMTLAEQTGKVKIHFNERCQKYDIESNTVEFLNEESGIKSLHKAEIVMGSDGSASAIRNELISSQIANATNSLLDYGYKELNIPAGSKMEMNALHIWPRGHFMLIALPNFDGSYTCTLFLPFKGEVSFETINTASQIQKFFKTFFPDAMNLIENLEEVFMNNPTGQMVTVKSYPWNYKDQCVLIGDAAHAIVPFFGQGMNCGFEDCTILNELLVEGKNLSEVFTQFSETRHLDSNAIADMAVANFSEMRDKVGKPEFLLQKEVEKILEKKFPDYVSRYTLVSFSRAPYSIANQLGQLQDQILSDLCRNIKYADEVDLIKAEKLIKEKLIGVMNYKELHSYSPNQEMGI